MRAQSHGNENDYEPTSLKNIIKTKNNIYASLLLFGGAHQESMSQTDLLLRLPSHRRRQNAEINAKFYY